MEKVKIDRFVPSKKPGNEATVELVDSPNSTGSGRDLDIHINGTQVGWFTTEADNPRITLRRGVLQDMGIQINVI